MPAEQARPVTRRELLNYAWLASLGILAVNTAGITLLFALPRFRVGEFGGVVRVGTLAEMPAENDSPLNNPTGKFWLVRSPAGLLALYKVCTHLDCLFNWDGQEGKFICPCHGSQFDREGNYLSGPAPRSLDHFVTQIVSPEGELLGETDAVTGAPLAAALPVETPDDEGEDGETPPAIISPDAGKLEDVAPAAESAAPVSPFSEDDIVQVDTGLRILGRSL